jgi:hypothetical protein
MFIERIVPCQIRLTGPTTKPHRAMLYLARQAWLEAAR